MEFGKVSPDELQSIDLRLPDDDPRSWIELRKGRRADGVPCDIHIGCPIWSAKSWVGQIFPRTAQQKDFFDHYARQFTGIELNTTHYRIPDSKTVDRWRDAAPPGFKFCPKWPQVISHRSPIWSHASLISEFITAAFGFEDRLGLTFLQLPPTFSAQHLPELERFLRLLPAGFPIAVEFRHHSYFRDHCLIDRAFEVLLRTNASTVITDVAGRRDVLHTTLPNARCLVRLIGNDLHPSDDRRLDEWAARLTTWIHLGLRELHFFLHEPTDANMPEFVARFIDRLNHAAGLELPKWKPADQGQQLGLF